MRFLNFNPNDTHLSERKFRRRENIISGRIITENIPEEICKCGTSWRAEQGKYGDEEGFSRRRWEKFEILTDGIDSQVRSTSTEAALSVVDNSAVGNETVAQPRRNLSTSPHPLTLEHNSER